MGNPNDEGSDKPISGYRELSTEEVDAINELKAAEAKTLALLDQNYPPSEGFDFHTHARWNAIARTHIEQGFMAAVRAIAQPRSYDS